MNDKSIAFIMDKGYLLPTIVAFRSFVKNKNPKSMYKVYIVTDAECEALWKENFSANSSYAFAKNSFDQFLSARNFSFIVAFNSKLSPK